MKELVEILTKSLVENPEAVEIAEHEGERTLVIEVHVDAADMGRVIGKGGRIAKAIRTVVKAASVREDRRVSVEFV